MNSRPQLTAMLLVGAFLLAIPASASATSLANAPNPGAAGGSQSTAPQATSQKKHGNGNCSAGALVLNAVNPFSHCNAASQTIHGVGQLPADVAGAAGSVAGGLAGDVMDQVASWMVTAAETVDNDVMKAVTATTTPELSSRWYESEFGYLAFFGAALAGIVALLGVLSAAVRGDPHALGEVFYGVIRAGLVTTMVISLTLLALKVADGISADVAKHMPEQFFRTLASAWGTKGWGGFASSALAFVTALLEVVVAVLLWVELLFRDAAIYVAVLFFPITLAMAIWPRAGESHARLVRILAIFIAFKPAALIVMMTGANLLLGGLSFYGGVGPSVGTILVGLAVLAMAAFAPWALMHLVGLDAGVMSSSGTRQRIGRGADSAPGGSSGGALGGELFGGAIAYGASTAAVGGSGGQGGSLASRAHAHGSAAQNGATGGGEGRRMLPGAVAAAAGMLPAGWQAAQSAGAKAQSLAAHGAARVHTAAGHGGSKPQPSPPAGGSSGRGAPHLAGVPGPPPPPADPTQQTGGRAPAPPRDPGSGGTGPVRPPFGGDSKPPRKGL